MSIPITNQIKLYMHCVLCTKQNLPQKIEAGWTPQGFQVWCLNHQCNIIHVDFEGSKHPANATRLPTEDEKTEQHKRENTH